MRWIIVKGGLDGMVGVNIFGLDDGNFIHHGHRHLLPPGGTLFDIQPRCIVDLEEYTDAGWFSTMVFDNGH